MLTDPFFELRFEIIEIITSDILFLYKVFECPHQFVEYAEGIAEILTVNVAAHDAHVVLTSLHLAVVVQNNLL